MEATTHKDPSQSFIGTNQEIGIEKAREDMIAQEIQTMSEYEVSRLSALIDGLLDLDNDELQELDTLITPRAATLLSKAFGSALGVALRPLANNEQTAPHQHQHQHQHQQSTKTEDAPLKPEEKTESNTTNSNTKKGLTAEQLRTMIRDPKYWKERDPQVVREVSEGYKVLYPTA